MSIYEWDLYDSAAQSWVKAYNGIWVSNSSHPIIQSGDFASVLGRIVLVKKGIE